ncbi:MAG: RNA-splicing ligase RtcB [Candidatus Lokiarchaeota archaeon]|nr:RNA-splicing ligase RtcB [Candidatus Lokiarchaeota archaeon]MBD3200997.1 RNA-splicing ligase RtcB [Candidatus Lokiarchaeota archaeon]
MKVEKIDDNIYEISPHKKNNFDMKVPVHIYANDYILNKIKQDRTLDQISNVATLKGIRKHAIALSDAHQGYGFCIGGVAGTDASDGMVSPGGVGYDINCGVRLLRTNLYESDVRKIIPDLLNSIYRNIPSGLGSEGKININYTDLENLVDNGLNWALENGYALEKDLEHCEENGFLKDADSSLVSKKAKQRGLGQVGSLGSGNHFLEIQKVDKIYNKDIAKKLGIHEEKQVTVMVHTGSRAFGHQVCTDSLRMVERAMNKYGIKVPDRELACVPADTKEAQNYLSQMACAANFGFNNRQLITHWIREVFENFFKKDVDELDMNLIYGVCHNILKKEEHQINGKKVKLNIHRKGATRAFPPNHPEIPQDYKSIGQPALIPGTMGSASYLCVGKQKAMDLSFGSTAHGAGRVMSRRAADRKYPARNVMDDLESKGIYIKAASMKVIAEEAPGAYKDVDAVVQVSHDLGIVEKVARFVPIGVVKG